MVIGSPSSVSSAVQGNDNAAFPEEMSTLIPLLNSSRPRVSFEDLKAARPWKSQRVPAMRVGLGFDTGSLGTLRFPRLFCPSLHFIPLRLVKAPGRHATLESGERTPLAVPHPRSVDQRQPTCPVTAQSSACGSWSLPLANTCETLGRNTWMLVEGLPRTIRRSAPTQCADAVVDTEKLRALESGDANGVQRRETGLDEKLDRLVRRESRYTETRTRIRSEYRGAHPLSRTATERTLTSRRRRRGTWRAEESPYVAIGLTRGRMQYLQLTLAERAHPVDRRRRQRDVCLDELERQRIRCRVSRVGSSASSEVGETRKP